jgi:hypothetical protein
MATWSARVLFLPEDPYVTEQLQRIDADFDALQRILAREQQRLDVARLKNDADRAYLRAAGDSNTGNGRFLRALDIIFTRVGARSDSIQGKRDNTYLTPNPPAHGSDLRKQSGTVNRFYRQIDWDSTEIASIGLSLRPDLGARIPPLLALLSAEKRKWQAVARWSQTKGTDRTQWHNVVEAEHAFRTALHGAAAVLAGFSPMLGIAQLDTRFDAADLADLDPSIVERVANISDALAQLRRVALFREVIAWLGLLTSAFLLFYTARFAITGKLPEWWQSLRWTLHRRGAQTTTKQ